MCKWVLAILPDTYDPRVVLQNAVLLGVNVHLRLIIN